MFTLDPVIVQSRLSIVKAFKEADESLEFKTVLDLNKPDLHSLGTLVQDNINKLYTLYLSFGITYEEFFEDLIEYLSRAGFLHRSDIDRHIDSPNGTDHDIVFGLDQEYPYSEVFINFRLTRKQ